MSVPDRVQVREALGYWERSEAPNAITSYETSAVIIAAARAWLDLEDALIIRRDENGQWPKHVVHALGKALYGWTDDEPFHKVGLPKYMVNAELGEIALVLDALSEGHTQ